jgi:glycosyltransferase involved in cell wall biosynthesis
MLFLEKLTFKSCDRVISTNESYKHIAIKRGHVPPMHVRVVRNGPNLSKFKPRQPDPKLRSPNIRNVAYLGNMNPQDGVEYLLRAAKYIIHELQRRDLRFFLIGKGDSFDDLVMKRDLWGLQPFVTFTGRIPDDEMLNIISSCDIGVQPDPKNPLNDISTMNKVMEYMALGKPVVAYDLRETRVSCSDCALYATPNSVRDLASKLLMLADDHNLRLEMGKRAIARVHSALEWKYSEQRLLELYSSLLEN